MENESNKKNIYSNSAPMYACVVLDAQDNESRFLAAKELLDIAAKTEADPSYVPAPSDFVKASKGIICRLPERTAAFYENFPFQIIYSKDADEIALPASTTKVLNLITAIPYITSVKERVCLCPADIQNGSGNYFNPNDILTLEDLMLGMMVASSNTCAMALARVIGSKILMDDHADASSCVAAFLKEMNRRALMLGCASSRFTSPSGFSKTTRSTAADLLKILISASSYNDILRVWNKKTYEIAVLGPNERTVKVKTTLVSETLEASYYLYGGKTGSLTYKDGTRAAALVLIAGPLAD